MGCRSHDGHMCVFESEGCRMNYAGMRQGGMVEGGCLVKKMLKSLLHSADS